MQTTCYLAIFECPPPHAHMKEFDPNSSSLSWMAAPASSSTFTTPSLPPPLAIIRGVHASIVLFFAFVVDREHAKRTQ